MKKVKLILMSFFILVLTFQKQALSRDITLSKCIQSAKNNFYLIEANKHAETAAEKAFKAKRSMSMPLFSGVLTAGRHYLDSYNFNQESSLINIDWAVGNLLLKTPEADLQNVFIKRAQKKELVMSITKRTAELYIMILQKQSRLELLQKRLALLKNHFDVAQALWKAGNKTQLDILRTQAEISILQEQIEKQNMDIENAWQELALLTGYDTSEKPNLLPVDIEKICTEPVPSLDRNSFENHPAVQKYSFMIKAEDIKTKAVYADRLPHLSISGGYINDRDPAGDGNFWQVDAGINLPLFRWGETGYKRQKYQAAARSLFAMKMNTERELKIKSVQIIERLKKIKKILALQYTREITCKKAFNFSRTNYEAGLITNLEYLAAEQQFTETQIAVQETRLEYILNLIDFYITTGQTEKIMEF